MLEIVGFQVNMTLVSARSLIIMLRLSAAIYKADYKHFSLDRLC